MADLTAQGIPPPVSIESLETAVNKDNYRYWLQEHDISDIARVQYHYSENGIDTMFSVVGSQEHLQNKLNEFRSLDPNDSRKSLVIIDNLGNNHWVTLVLHKNDVNEVRAFYVDSLGSPLDSTIKDELSKVIKISNINDFSMQQQVDGHNCGIFALENAFKINESVKHGDSIDVIKSKIIDYQPNADDLKETRKLFAQNLQNDQIRSDHLGMLRNSIRIDNDANLKPVVPRLDLDRLSQNNNPPPKPELLELFILNPTKGKETGLIWVNNPEKAEGFSQKFKVMLDNTYKLHSPIKPEFFPYMFLGSALTLPHTDLMSKIGVQDMYFSVSKHGKTTKTVKFAFLVERYGEKKIMLRTVTTGKGISEYQHFNDAEFSEIMKKFGVSDANKNSYEIDGKLFQIDSKFSLNVEELKISQQDIADKFNNLVLQDDNVGEKFVKIERSPEVVNNFENSFEKLSDLNLQTVKSGAQDIFADFTKIYKMHDQKGSGFLGTGKLEAASHGFAFGAIAFNFKYRYHMDVHVERILGKGYADLVFLSRKDSNMNKNWYAKPIVVEFKSGADTARTGNRQVDIQGYFHNPPNVRSVSKDGVKIGVNFEKVSVDVGEVKMFQSRGFFKQLFDGNSRVIKDELKHLYYSFSNNVAKSDKARNRYITNLMLGEIMGSENIQKQIFQHSDSTLKDKLTTFLLTDSNGNTVILNVVTGDDNLNLNKNIPVDGVDCSRCKQINIYLNPLAEKGFDKSDSKKSVFLSRDIEVSSIDYSLEKYRGRLQDIGNVNIDNFFEGEDSVKRAISDFGEQLFPLKSSVEYESDFQAIVQGLFSASSDSPGETIRTFVEANPSKDGRIDLAVHRLGEMSDRILTEKNFISMELKAVSITESNAKQVIDGAKNQLKDYVNQKSFSDMKQATGIVMVFNKNRNAKSAAELIKTNVETYSIPHTSNRIRPVQGLDIPDDGFRLPPPAINSKKRGRDDSDDLFSDVKKVCRRSRKKRSANGCVFNVDGSAKDLEKIPVDSPEFIKHIESINSEDFIKHLKDLPENERAKYLAVAESDSVVVRGSFNNEINKMIKVKHSEAHFLQSNEIFSKVNSGNIFHDLVDHRSSRKGLKGVAISPGLIKKSIGKIAKGFSTGVSKAAPSLVFKDLLSGLIRGDIESVAIIGGLIAGDIFLEKIGAVLGKKGDQILKATKSAKNLFKGLGNNGTLKLALNFNKFVGKALKAAGPFLGAATSGMTIYSLVRNVNDFKSGNKEALASLIGDSISLATTVAIVAIQVIMATTKALAVAGPIGVAVAIVIDVLAAIGVQIYYAVKKVEAINNIIKLSGWEKFKEGWRAFFGLEPSEYLRKLIERKQVNTKIIEKILEFLRSNPSIQRYITPTGYKDCDQIKSDPDNVAYLNERKNVELERAVPDNSELFCHPSGSGGGSRYTYYCKNAMGIMNPHSRKGNTVFDLGNGTDSAIGTSQYPNVFLIGEGQKYFTGGNDDDMFILKNGYVNGYFQGSRGDDMLVLKDEFVSNDIVNIDLRNGELRCNGNSNVISLSSIEKISGREGMKEVINCACNTLYVDGNSGSSHSYDEIVISDVNCDYSMSIVVRPYTKIKNYALQGNFNYVLQYQGNFDVETGSIGKSNHNYILKYNLNNISGINFDAALKKVTIRRYSDNGSSTHTLKRVEDGMYVQPRIITKDNAHIRIKEDGHRFVFIDTGTNGSPSTGCSHVSNIFVVSGKNKNTRGGSKDDMFILTSDSVTGSINGLDGTDSLVLVREFARNESIFVDIVGGKVSSSNNEVSVTISNIEKITGRQSVPENITCSCTTQFVDSQGGSVIQNDEINVETADCNYKMHIIIKENTNVKNFAVKGDFYYDLQYDGDFDAETNVIGEANHNYLLNYPLKSLEGIIFDTTEEKLSLKKFLGGVSSHTMKKLIDGMYIQPKVLTNDNAQIRVKEDGEVFVFIDTTMTPFASAGSSDVPNVFMASGGNMNITGGNDDDVFILRTGHVTGDINGGLGSNALILEEGFASGKYIVVDLDNQVLSYVGGSESININGIKGVTGRDGIADVIICSSDTELIDGRGGKNETEMDRIEIPERHYDDGIRFVIRNNTIVTNLALSGDFYYDLIDQGDFDLEPEFLNNTNHNYLLNFQLSDILSVELNETVPVIKFERTEYTSSYKIKPVSEEDTFYAQPRFLTNDNTELKIARAGSLYGMQNTDRTVEDIIANYPVVASRLDMTLFIHSNVKNESVIIGTDAETEVIGNNPAFPSHLCGNLGKNIYMITSGNDNITSIPDVTIYNLNEGNFTDTLDISQLVMPIRKKSSQIELPYLPDVVQDEDDLLIKLSFNNTVTATIILKTVFVDNWFENLEIILNSTRMKLYYENDTWIFKPLPLFFDRHFEFILLTPDDVESNIEMIVPRSRFPYFDFTYANSTNLIATNIYNTHLDSDEYCTILFSDFYTSSVMKTIYMKFSDEGIALKKVSNLGIFEFYELEKQFKERVYNSVFNNVIMDTKINEEKAFQPELTNATVAPDFNFEKTNRDINQEYIPVFQTETEDTEKDKIDDSPLNNIIHHHAAKREVSNNDKESEYQSFFSYTLSSVKSSVDGLLSKLGNSFTIFNIVIPSVSTEEDNWNETLNLDTSRIETNSTLFLLDLIVRKVTGQKYVMSEDRSVSLLVAESYSVTIVGEFEQLLKQAALTCGISVRNLNFNPITVQSKLIAKIRNGKYFEISKILLEATKRACPVIKQTNKFLEVLNNQLNKMLAHKELAILSENGSESYHTKVSAEVQSSKLLNQVLGNKTESLGGPNNIVHRSKRLN